MTYIVQRRSGKAVALLTALLFVLALIAPLSLTNSALAGDPDPSFSNFDFVAAQPTQYDHSTGIGGMYGTGSNATTRETLNGEEFTCGDIVVFFTYFEVDGGGEPTQPLVFNYTFAMAPTGGSGGPGYTDVVGVSVENTNGTPSTATATLTNETMGGDTPYVKGSTLEATVEVTGLEAGEEYVVRTLVQLTCPPDWDGTASGVIQADLDTVSYDGDNQPGAGNQSVNLQNPDELIVEPGSITIIKDADPNDPQDFAFTSSELGNFTLDDDGDGALSNTQVFNDVEANASYTVTESTVTGWTLTNIVCEGAATSTVTIGASGGFDPGDDSVTIDLAADEDVSCTFTNTQDRGSITIIKNANPNDPQDFEFTSVQLGNFTLDDDDDGTNSNSETFTELTAGVYAVSENVVSGWTLTNIVCEGATNSTVTIGGTGVFVAGDTEVSIDLAAGEDVSCTFTNTEDPEPGTITIIKDSVPNDPQDFSFTATGTGVNNFTLDDDDDGTNSNIQTFTDLSAGNFVFTEALVEGWILSNIVCTGGTNSTVTIGQGGGFDPGDTSVTIDLVAEEGIICTFTNTKLLALNVTKTVIANLDRTYEWSITKEVDPDTLDLVNSEPGTVDYTVVVTQEGSTDSDYQLGGVITISNPNSIPVTVADLSDQIDGSIDATITTAECATPFDVPANGSVECVYRVDPNSLDGSEAENVATVTAELPALSGSATEDVVYVIDEEINAEVTIEDTNQGFADTYGNPVVINTTTEFNYSVDFDCADVDYGDEDSVTTVYDNTATIVETGDNASAEVTVNCTRTPDMGEIVIQKLADPAGSPWVFLFDGPGDLGNGLLSGDSNYETLDPGIYVISEDLDELKNAWLLTSIVCESTTGESTWEVDLDAGSVTIDLAAGDRVSCNFYNEAQPGVVIPEAPLAILFPVIGLVMAAGAYLFWRRRNQFEQVA